MKKRKATSSADKQACYEEPNITDDPNDDDEDESQDIVNVDFEFFDPKQDDFHGVKALLRSYLDDTAWDLGCFVDIILSQSTVGTVIKTAEDESPIGLITALNLGRYKDQRCMQHVSQFLKKNCCDKLDAVELEAIFDNHPNEVALLVSERLINIPEELAPPLYKGLLDEISWATEDEPAKALRDSFRFKHYLIISRVFQQLPKKRKGSKTLKKEKKQRQHKSSEHERNEELIYTKPEDEQLHELSHWSCKFPVSSESLAAHEVQGLKEFRLVMLLSAEKMEHFKSEYCRVEQ